MKKIIIASSIGTLFEWAEFSFYAYLITKFTYLFFPTVSTHFAFLLSLATFTISYLVRPIGSIIFGYIGDRFGRKSALSYSIILMGVTTFSMGILPTYQMIGLAAPLLLIFLRMMQGIAVAGEFNGAAIYIAEHDKNRTYLSSSWVSTSSALGLLIGSIAALIVSIPSMPIWAWRVPFLIGAFSCLMGFYIRKYLTETDLFVANNDLTKRSILNLIKSHKKSLFKTMTLAAFVGSYIYTCNIWWLTYVIQHNYFSSIDAHLLATIGQTCVVVFTPLMALLAQSINGKQLMAFGFIGGAIVAFCLFTYSATKEFTLLGCIIILYALCNAAVTSTMFKYLMSLFPTKIRYSGQTIAWNFAVAIFGGTAPLIAQALSIYSNFSFMPSLYVILTALVAWITNCVIFTKVHENTDLLSNKY